MHLLVAINKAPPCCGVGAGRGLTRLTVVISTVELVSVQRDAVCGMQLSLMMVAAHQASLCFVVGTAGYLSFHPRAQYVVHALKGLACRAPGLLAHAEVTKNIIFFSMGPKLKYPTVVLPELVVFV